MFTVGPAFWGGEEGDPYWSYVKTLLHFDGDLTDMGSGATSFGNTGGAVLSTTNTKFGAGSLDCTASADARCFGSGNGVGIGTGDFCLELWFYDPSSTGNQYVLLHSGTDSIRVITDFSGGLTVDLTGVSPVGYFSYSYASWNHLAITRSGNSWKTWLNGVEVQSWTNSTHNGGGSASFWIGSGSSSATGMRLLIDDLRLTVGVPRYTSTFTPSGPFPNRGL